MIGLMTEMGFRENCRREGRDDVVGATVCVRGVSEGDVNLEIDIGGCAAAKPTFPVKVVENVSVKLSVCILSDGNGPIRTESEIREMLPEVNDIFEQVGMTFYIDSVVVTNVDEACQPVFDGDAIDQHLSFDDVANILPASEVVNEVRNDEEAPDVWV